MRKYLLLVLVLGMASSGSAQLESKINKTCGAEYEPLVSMHEVNSTSNNIGHPATYENKVCVKGLAESYFDTDCDGATGFFVSSNTTTAHFSESSGYNYRVCTGNVLTEVRSSCLANEEPLFKVSDKIDGFGRHVAGPLFPGFDNYVCGRFAPPSNVSLAMDLSLSGSTSTYFDDREVSSGFEFSGLAEFPYLVKTNTDTVAGIVVDGYQKASYDVNGKDRLKIRRSSDKSTYYLVFTRGGHDNIENSQEELLSGELLRNLNPSFGEFIEGEPNVRAVLSAEAPIESTLSIGKGNYDVRIEKIEDGKVRIESE